MSGVDSLDQDAEGFLWLGTPQGLIRYDGTDMRVVDPGSHFIVSGCARTGRVRTIRVVGERRELVEISGTTVVTTPSPASAQTLGAACSDDGFLWAVADGVIWRQSLDGAWTKVDAKAPSGAWEYVAPGSKGAVLGLSDRSIYRVRPEGGAELLARLHRIMACLIGRDGALIALDWMKDGARLVRIRDGTIEELEFQPHRPMALAEREGTIWAAFDSLLVGIRSDGTRVEIKSSPPAFAGGGPLLVDREGALWIGTSRGLVEFPEPDTAGLDPDPGGGRWLHQLDGELYLSTWGGAGRIVEENGRAKVVWSVDSIGSVCKDARGRIWSVGFEELQYHEPSGRVVRIPFEHVGSMAPCALDGSGTLWMPTLRGLLRLERNQDRPVIERLPGGGQGDGDVEGSVLLDRNGRIWVGGSGRVCRSELSSRAWSCEPIPSGTFVTDLLETDRGRIWAASEGVYERGDDGAWRRLPLDSTEALAPFVTGLAPSPRGGVWLIGRGTIVRVGGESVAGRMTVVERLGGWHGIPSTTTFDALERPDGTVWLVVESTLVRVPGRVRASPPAPSHVAVTSLVVEGASRPVTSEFRSPYRRSRFEARVSAFSYRDPSLVRYRFRMNDDEPWSQPTSTPVFQFYNVASGRYALRFAASLDGEHWTETAAPISFRIDRPWFLQLWFVALAVLAMATAAWGVHRVRVSRLLALERQRTRIAMDLHDAIGSGLGSIGLLAGLGSRQATDAETRREISDQIATMASELGMSLSEIVWSLRLGSERLEALAQYLKERANRLFVDGSVRFRTEYPASWPDAPLSLPLRRNLLLIAIEALHNAAKHAQASEVRLGMAPNGPSWSLWVVDDGVGLGRGVHPGTGMGLANMKRRAEEIGATIEWTPGAVTGTRVTVIFDPRSP